MQTPLPGTQSTPDLHPSPGFQNGPSVMRRDKAWEAKASRSGLSCVLGSCVTLSHPCASLGRSFSVSTGGLWTT